METQSQFGNIWEDDGFKIESDYQEEKKMQVFVAKTDLQTAGRHGSARLGGTPCDSLKTLLEPFSVPLLRKKYSVGYPMFAKCCGLSV